MATKLKKYYKFIPIVIILLLLGVGLWWNQPKALSDFQTDITTETNDTNGANIVRASNTIIDSTNISDNIMSDEDYIKTFANRDIVNYVDDNFGATDVVNLSYEMLEGEKISDSDLNHLSELKDQLVDAFINEQSIIANVYDVSESSDYYVARTNNNYEGLTPAKITYGKNDTSGTITDQFEFDDKSGLLYIKKSYLDNMRNETKNSINDVDSSETILGTTKAQLIFLTKGNLDDVKFNIGVQVNNNGVTAKHLQDGSASVSPYSLETTIRLSSDYVIEKDMIDRVLINGVPYRIDGNNIDYTPETSEIKLNVSAFAISTVKIEMSENFQKKLNRLTSPETANAVTGTGDLTAYIPLEIKNGNLFQGQKFDFWQEKGGSAYVENRDSSTSSGVIITGAWGGSFGAPGNSGRALWDGSAVINPSDVRVYRDTISSGNDYATNFKITLNEANFTERKADHSADGANFKMPNVALAASCGDHETSSSIIVDHNVGIKVMGLDSSSQTAVLLIAGNPMSGQLPFGLFKIHYQDSGNICLTKRAKVPELTEGKANYSLAGAQYGVYTDSSCKNRAKDINGNESGIITDKNGYGEAQNLSVGDYYVKELVSSPNYQLDTTIHHVKVISGTTTAIDNGISSEPHNYGYIDLQKKSANESITNGNSCYSLEGAVYGIYRDKKCSDKVMQITTDKNGYATTKGYKENGQLVEDRITFSTYYIKEITAPKGFAIDSTVYTVTFKYDDGNYKHRYVNETGKHGIQPVNWQTREKGVVYDRPQGDPIGVLLGKVDNETTLSNGLGGATLKGAQFEVTYYDAEGFGDQNDVDTTVLDSIKSKSTMSKSWVFETDDKGQVRLLNSYKVSGDELYVDYRDHVVMPLGTVVIREVKAPQGYLNSNEGKYWVRSITSDGTSEDVETYNPPDGETAFKEQVVRGDLAFTKANAQTQQRLAGVPFVIKSKTTGEWHVAVTDENGQYSTEAKFAAHSYNTNKNDEAVTQNEDGTYSVDTSKLDNTYGIWFGKYVDSEGAEHLTTPDDTKGALPYESESDGSGYEIIELDVPINQYLEKVDIMQYIKRDGWTVDVGTIDDQHKNLPYIKTMAHDGESGKTIKAGKDMKLVDRVEYSYLTEGSEYELHATLFDKATSESLKDSSNNELTATKRFKAEQASGYVDVEYSIDTTSFVGKQVVVFEKLYEVKDGKLSDDEVATHEDIADSEQTVRIINPKLSTTAHNGEGAKKLAVGKAIKVVDRVEYSDVAPAQDYIMQATLYDKDTKEPLKDADGNDVVASTKFTTNDTKGYVNVEFTIDTTSLIGKKLVVFESMYEVNDDDTPGDKIGDHEDINDDNQTVEVITPTMGTKAISGNSSENVIANDEGKIIDTISYNGLEENKKYTFTGFLMNKNTGLPLVIPVANKSTSTTETTTDNQKYYEDDIEITNPVDEADLKAFLTFVEDGVKDKSLTYESYKALFTKYTAILNNCVFASSNPTIQNDSGELQLEFAFDATNLSDIDVVVYELCFDEEGTNIVNHMDITDTDQTVSVKKPEIGTTLIDKASGNHDAYISQETHLIDTVEYKHLATNKEYTVSGILMNKATGEPLLVNDKTITATTKFVPQSEDGIVELEFVFDSSALDGASIVAFEEIQCNGKIVAEEKDINNETQTVTFKIMPAGTSQEGSFYDKTGSPFKNLWVGLLVFESIAMGGVSVFCLRKWWLLKKLAMK